MKKQPETEKESHWKANAWLYFIVTVVFLVIMSAGYYFLSN